jgi:hypothetical protein
LLGRSHICGRCFFEQSALVSENQCQHRQRCSQNAATRGSTAARYTDPNGIYSHDFLRSRNGTFISFDPPGPVDTYPTSVNAAGVIVGNYHEATGIEHGLLRISGHDE